MKKILFKSLSLLNFRGIREVKYHFGENITIFSGCNGIGKTSIIDAITWVLFDTDHRGNKIDIKTWDANHKIIPEIPHEVELVLSVDGEEVILKRALVDSWKGESVKNTYKFYVDGEATTAGDYKKKVSEICDATVFRLCSSPTEFVSLDWKEQRKFLQSMVGDVTEDDITNGDSKFDFLKEALQKKNIEDYNKHLKYKRTEVQKLLDQIPVRLAELNKALPDTDESENLDQQLADKKSSLSELEKKIQEVTTGGADTVKRDGIRKKMEFANKRKDNMEQSARNLSTEYATKHQSDIITSNSEYAKAESLVNDLKAKMSGYTETEIHLNQQRDECKAEVKELNDKLAELSNRAWSWNDDDSYCPYCGQKLPSDNIAKLKEESKARFNQIQATAKSKLNEQFDKVSKTYKEAKRLLQELDEDRKVTTNQLVDSQKKLKEAETKFDKVKAEVPKSYEDVLKENESYKEVCAEIQGYESELTNVSYEDNSELLKELASEKESLDKQIEDIVDKISLKKYYDKVSEQIEDVKKEKKTYQEQLDELDEKIDIVSEYYQRGCQILEDKVNERFSFVKFSMFQKKLDGTQSPFCECYHDGVPYHDLNTAAKINAGIDIASVISKHFDISVPMLLDKCESNLAPIYTGGQQIRLIVSKDVIMTVKYED